MPRTVFAYYYPWYSGPPAYRHWIGGQPGTVTGASIPLLGTYDSRDSTFALNLQMQWIQAAKIDVLVLDWWGQGSYEDGSVPAIMSKAAQYGIKVSFLIDSYAGRTAASTAQDIAYIYRTYGSSPAFFRTSRPTMYGTSSGPRGIFFVYNPDGTGFAQAMDALHGTANDAIVLVRTDDGAILTDAGVRTQLSYFHADGMFNFGYYSRSAGYQNTLPSSPDYLLVFAATPGFDNTKIGGNLQINRNQGASYDDSWLPLATQKPEGVAIDSFNEWSETSAIEPALPNSYGPYPHLDYSGAYGLTGDTSAGAYLIRTAEWASVYKGA